MRFTTLAENEDVAALARRLYRVATPEGLVEAERVLLQANPWLADPTRRTAGAVIMVPEVAGATASDEARSEQQLMASILQEARNRLGEVSEALGASIESRRADVKATLDQLGSAEMRRLLKEEPPLKDVFSGVSNEAKTEATEIEALDKLQQQAISELGQDLDDLLKSVGGEAGRGQPGGGRPKGGQPAGPQPGGPQSGRAQPVTPAGVRRATTRTRRAR